MGEICHVFELTRAKPAFESRPSFGLLAMNMFHFMMLFVFPI